MPWGPFHEQRIYKRRQDIHAVYGGQQQGGICTPSKHAVIIVFTGSSGEQHGYADGWSSEGVFRYFGEGQVGDMVFERGNRAIRDHLVDGKDLVVFQTRGREGVRFLGQFECAGYTSGEAHPSTMSRGVERCSRRSNRPSGSTTGNARWMANPTFLCHCFRSRQPERGCSRSGN